MYALEHLKVQGTECSWKQFAVCGRLELLERVCMGQERPECWRVMPENAYDGTVSLLNRHLKTTIE